MGKGELVIGDSSSDEEEQKQTTSWGTLKSGTGKAPATQNKVKCIGDSSSDDEGGVVGNTNKATFSNSKPVVNKQVVKAKPKPKEQVVKKPEVKKAVTKKPVSKSG